MLCHEITKEERKEIFAYKNMIFSNDVESIKLGLELIRQQFGNYRLYDKNTISLNMIFEKYLHFNLEENYFSKYDLNMLDFWLVIALLNGYLYDWEN